MFHWNWHYDIGDYRYWGLIGDRTWSLRLQIHIVCFVHVGMDRRGHLLINRARVGLRGSSTSCLKSIVRHGGPPGLLIYIRVDFSVGLGDI